MSTLLTISAAAIALLLASPLVISNLLLQPVQATGSVQGITSIQTPNPVALGNNCNVANAELTFNAQGSNGMTLTSGTFTVTNSSNSSQIWWSGGFQSASGTPGGAIIYYNVDKNGLNGGEFCGNGIYLEIIAFCTQPPPNPNIVFTTSKVFGGLNGNVDCKYINGTTTQPSSSSPVTGTTTPSHDSDGDGIPDSTDRCTHDSNPRCFKEEGDASSGTTTQEQPTSSSSSSGNQTR